MRRIILCLITLLSVFSFISCAGQPAGHLTPGEYLRILGKAVSTGNLPVKRFDELDPYESYFLALKTDEAGFSSEAAVLARHSWEDSTGLVSERAAELAVELYFDMKNYSEAEFLATIAGAEFPDNYRLRRYVAEAAYWQRRDAVVEEALNVLASFGESGTDYELFVFRAVSSYRMGSPDWKEQWIKMFTDVPASSFILRAWDYLSYSEADPFSLFPGYGDLIEAKYQQASGEYTAAARYYRSWIDSRGSSALNNIIIDDIENLYLRTGLRNTGAELLEKVASDGGTSDAYFGAARLYRRAGRMADAQRCMDLYMETRDPDGLTDRELWYSFDIRVRRNLSSAVDSIDFYSASWADPSFFEDSLENLCTNLARRRRWNDIAELAKKLEISGPASTYDRCRYIAERAAELGYIAPVSFEVPYTDTYYRILRGDNLSELRGSADSTDAFASCDVKISDFLNEHERLLDGLLRYGTGDILAEAERYSGYLSESFLARCANEEASAGRHLESIRIMYRFAGVPGRTGLTSLYPDIYRDEIEAAAERSGIDPQLLFGIVWKESGFESGIVSRSGAVGLSQLMPSTAGDVAGRMGVDSYDLTLPEDNLEIGAWYFNWLISYVGNAASAVLSYNGGPGRVRGWMREYPDLPDDLFYEIVPVQETHLYGKKVITASVLYGLLYYGINPSQTLKLFF